jgi:hypothetical protein
MVRSEGNMSLKNPVTPPGIDPGAVRLVAQRLNHYTTTGLESYCGILNNGETVKNISRARYEIIAKVIVIVIYAEDGSPRNFGNHPPGDALSHLRRTDCLRITSVRT